MMASSTVEILSSTADYGGYVCPTCGYWVNEYANHICPNNQTPIVPTIPFVIPSYPYWPDPRIDALEKRMVELEKKLKPKDGEKNGE